MLCDIAASTKRMDVQLLSNHVKHAGSHNKIQEEKEMWKQRVREKDDWSDRIRMNYLPPPVSYRGCLVSDMLDLSPSLSPSPPPRSYYSNMARRNRPQKSARPRSSNYWKKKLLEFEENHPLRWGHSGYKDHHPEEFASAEDTDVEKICHRQLRKRKKTARLMNIVTKKTRYEKREKKRTVLTKKKKRTCDCSRSSEESGISSHVYEESRRQKRKRRAGVDGERRKSRWRKEQKDKEIEFGAATSHQPEPFS